MRNYNQISNELNSLLDKNEIDKAMEYVKTMKNEHEGENCAYAVLENENSTPELIENVLECYLELRHKCDYRNWWHSVKNLTIYLWTRELGRLDDWIKKFYKASFDLSKKHNNGSYSDILINHFFYCAKWNDDPKDFYITEENTSWYDWESEYVKNYKRKLELMPFKSEDDYLKFEEEYKNNE